MKRVAYPSAGNDRGDYEEGPCDKKINLGHVWIARRALPNDTIDEVTADQGQRKPKGGSDARCDVGCPHDPVFSAVPNVCNGSKADTRR